MKQEEVNEIQRLARFEIYDTTHSFERLLERNIPEEAVMYLCHEIIAFIKAGKGRDIPILVFSQRKYKQGIVISYRKDKFRNEIDIITVLPPEKEDPKDNTQKVYVERYSYFKNKVSQELVNYIQNICNISKEDLDKYSFAHEDIGNVMFTFVQGNLDGIFFNNKVVQIWEVE